MSCGLSTRRLEAAATDGEARLRGLFTPVEGDRSRRRAALPHIAREVGTQCTAPLQPPGDQSTTSQIHLGEALALRLLIIPYPTSPDKNPGSRGSVSVWGRVEDNPLPSRRFQACGRVYAGVDREPNASSPFGQPL